MGGHTVVPTKCIGFVRYKFRASAEFAKEAMMGQSLLRGGNGNNGGSSGKEALVVRWANDDPNPVAIRRVKREREAEVIDAMQRAEAKMPPEQRLALQQMRLLQRAREGLKKKKKGGGGGDSEDEDDEVNTDPFGPHSNTRAYDEKENEEDEGGRGGSISGGGGGDGGAAREVGDDDDDVEGTNAAKKQRQRRDVEDDDAGPAKLVAGPLSPSRWAEEAAAAVANGEEAGRVAKAIGLGPEAAILGAQQVAYQAFIAAGGDPDQWDPAELAAVVGAMSGGGGVGGGGGGGGGRDSGDDDSRGGRGGVSAEGDDEDDFEFDAEDYPVFDVEEV